MPLSAAPVIRQQSFGDAIAGAALSVISIDGLVFGPLEAPAVAAVVPSTDSAVGVSLSVTAYDGPVISITPLAPLIADQSEDDVTPGATLSVSVEEPGTTAAETNADASAYLQRGDVLAIGGTGLGRFTVVEAVDGAELTLLQAWASGTGVTLQPFRILPMAQYLLAAAHRELMARAEYGPGSRWHARASTVALTAGVVDLATADGDWVPVTGTGACTDLGEVPAGERFILDLGSAVTFAAGLLDADELAAAAGDQVTVVSRGAGAWALVDHLVWSA